eukprot:1503362-Alexandrium_andersonii.AAC.1
MRARVARWTSAIPACCRSWHPGWHALACPLSGATPHPCSRPMASCTDSRTSWCTCRIRPLETGGGPLELGALRGGRAPAD